MAKIIQFPAKSSNAYTNLEQLIAVSDSTASLEQYFEVMAVCDEAGYFLPGEIEKLTEQVRQKRLDLAKPELKPAVTRIRLSETVDMKPLFLEYSHFPAEITWQSTDTQAESAVTAWKK